MSVEHNKNVVRRLFEEAINGEDPALAESLIHPEFIDHDGIPGQPSGSAAGPFIVKFVNDGARQAGAPRAAVVIDELIGEGDTVAARWHAGPLRAFVFFRLQDGRVVERRALLHRA